MKTKYLLLSLAATFAMFGCASNPSKESAEKAPPKAKKVKILMYDTTQRPKKNHLDICGATPPSRPFKIIALLTCEGAVDEEVVATTAMCYRARQIGADGVTTAPTTTTMKQSTPYVADSVGQQIMLNAIGIGTSSARSVFRAHAFVYTDK